jgi:DNA replicative helicase MCM subunit Mcm2 (Cdc46/Mcm family)
MNKLINLYDVSAAYLQNIKEEIEKNKTKINLIFNQLEKIKHMKIEDLSREDIEEIISENGMLIVESSDVIRQQSQLVEKFKSWTSILEKVIKKYPFDVSIFTSEILYKQQDVTLENLSELLQYNERQENYEVCQMILNTINLINSL